MVARGEERERQPTARRLRFAAAMAAAGLLAITGCEGTGDWGGSGSPALSSSAPAGLLSWSFRCPRAGTFVQTSIGGALHYEGPEPGDPTVCRLRNNRGQPFRDLYSLYPLPGPDEAAYRRTLDQLFPATAGRSVRQQTINRTGGANTYLYDQQWRVVGFERIAVPAGSFDAVVIESREQGLLDNHHLSFRRRWFDVATGTLVKVTVRLVRGRTEGLSWDAVRVVAPSG